MNYLSFARTLLMLPLLTACAADRYWYEPPPPAQQSTLSSNGTWQGLVRDDYSYRLGFGALTGRVSIRCADYQDQIRLDVAGGEIEAVIGSNSAVRFTTPIGPDGRFEHRMPVQGDTWVYGGVGIYHEEPTLSISGDLDPHSGIGQGTIAVTPGPREHLGCYGHFQVSRNAGPPRQEQPIKPFRIKYWIDEVDESDNDNIWLLR